MRAPHGFIVIASLLAACSGGGGSSDPPAPPAAPVLALVAGHTGGAGSSDGLGAAARFNSPQGIAIDAQGVSYVADSDNRLIRRVSPQGQVTTIAGTRGQPGHADGNATAARFGYPTDVAVDSTGNLYVADGGTVRRIRPSGVVETLAGNPQQQGYADGPGTAALFREVAHIALDDLGDVYVADAGNCAIRRVHAGTGAVTTVAGGPGKCDIAPAVPPDGPASEARFRRVAHLAVGPAREIYVSEGSYVRRITADGRVSYFAGHPTRSGLTDGSAEVASFGFITAMTIDRGGSLFVFDQGYILRRISPQGVVSTVTGTYMSPGLEDGPLGVARFKFVLGLAASAAGGFVASEGLEHLVRAISPGLTSVATLAGLAPSPGAADGAGASARFLRLAALAADGDARLYAADSNLVRAISPDGSVATVPLNGLQLQTPGFHIEAMIADASGIHAVGNERCPSRPTAFPCLPRIVQFDRGGRVLGERQLGGTRYATALARDAESTYFVGASMFNPFERPTAGGTIERVRATDTSSMILGLGEPRGLLFVSGSLFHVADAGKHVVYRVDAFGAQPLAGALDTPGFADGNGSAARFNTPRAVVRDAAGHLYVADSGNHVVRKIAPDGTVTTFAGMPGVSGFFAGTLPGVLASPQALAIVGNDLYVAMPTAVAVIRNFR